jgi:uncharacterized protein YkwD
MGCPLHKITEYAVRSAAIFSLTLSSASAEDDELVTLINAYRSKPQTCEGKKFSAAGTLAPDAALARVNPKRGEPLEEALRGAGYHAAHVQTITVTGPTTARGVMTFLQKQYCKALLTPRVAEIGVAREGNSWRILLAQPLLSPNLGDWKSAGMRVLKLVNDARSKPRSCGNDHFSAAAPLDWNAQLAAAALAHSSDMAKKNYFSHASPDGAEADERANRQSYEWQRIGENVATGQGSPQQVVRGWLASPGHCANIMNPEFEEMGAAYAVNEKSDGTIYWTQVFGARK